MPIEILHWGNRDFLPFLLWWPWPWPDDLQIRTLPVFPVYRMCKCELPTSRLSKVIVWQVDRLLRQR